MGSSHRIESGRDTVWTLSEGGREGEQALYHKHVVKCRTMVKERRQGRVFMGRGISDPMWAEKKSSGLAGLMLCSGCVYAHTCVQREVVCG